MTMSKEDREARFARFIDENMEHNHIEADVVKRIIAAFADAGNPIVGVDDREEVTPVNGEREILEQVFNLDECWLFPEGGGWVRIVLGNEWDCVVDYTTSLDDTLATVNEYIDRHQR